MASISSSNTSLPASWLSESNVTSHRDASFSSYQNSSDEAFVRTLGRHSIAKQQHDLMQDSRPKKVEDGEIDVFRADKYFNGEIVREHDTKSARNSLQLKRDHDEKVVSNLSKLKLQPRTPSIYSESSSNSQSALLRRVQRNPSRGTLKNNSGNLLGKRSFLTSCYCCDKKSVDIENREFYNRGSKGFDDPYERVVPRVIKTSLDTAEITRLNKIRQQHTDPFAVHEPEPLSAMKKVQVQDEEDEELLRKKSLEVFGSNDIDEDDEGSKRFSLDKRLSMLSWDAIPSSGDNQDIIIPVAPSESYRDTESDASSDLFEIECLSSTPNPVVQGVARPLSDGCATPTTAYAPSEASIDWSVVTASAADFSVVSDSDEQRSVLTSVSRSRMPPRYPTSNAKMAVSKEVQKPRSVGLLSGCKSYKAVRVAGDNCRTSPGKGKSDSQKVHRFSDSYSPVTRFKAEAKLPGHTQSHRQTKTISSTDLLYIQ